MKGLVSRRLAIVVTTAILLIAILPLTTFAKSFSGEPRGASHPPKVTMQVNPTTGKSDPVVTIMQQCPASGPINATPFSAGDQISITSASFTSTDPSESTESEEANNALAVFDTNVNIAPVFIKLNQTTSFTFRASAGDQLKACFVIYDGDEVGTISYTVTPRDDAHLKIEHIVDLVGNVVTASHKICDVVKCTELIAVPISLLDKLFTIFNLGQAAAQANILGQKLAALNQAIKQFGLHSHQACVAAQAAFVANQNLHQTLLNLIPGLELIFPLPAGGTPGCR